MNIESNVRLKREEVHSGSKDLKYDLNILFPNHQTIKPINQGNLTGKGSMERRNNDYPLPIYDSIQRLKEDIQSLEQKQQKVTQKGIKASNSQYLCPHIDMAEFCDHNSLKSKQNTARQELKRLNNLSENYDRYDHQNISSGDFIQKSMSILEFIKNKTADSISLSKIKDETIPSFDFRSSPELGKTKNTSAFSGGRLQNHLVKNGSKKSKYNDISNTLSHSEMSRSESILRKLINSSDF